MKKIISIVLVAFIAVSLLSVCAFAAGGINADEQRVLDALNKEFFVNGKGYKLDAAWLNQAKNFLLRDNVDLTKEQADKILDYISQARGIAESSTVIGGRKFTDKANRDIIALVDKTANVVGLTVVVAGKGASFTMKDIATGDVVYQSSATIKATGAKAPVLPVTAAAVLFVLAAAGAYGVKKYSL